MDKGQSWHNITDGLLVSGLNVSTIEIDPHDLTGNTIYIGTDWKMEIRGTTEWAYLRVLMAVKIGTKNGLVFSPLILRKLQ